MTPLDLARDLERSIAFLRDVVGYGLLRDETSDLDLLAQFPESSRATVLAWYWPQSGLDEDFDPFAEFAAARQQTSEVELHKRLRTFVGKRAFGFLVVASLAAKREVDEVLGATCWSARCSGDRLLGVLDGTRGLDLSEILQVTSALGLRFVDPLDSETAVPAWTSAGAELLEAAVRAVEGPVQLGRMQAVTKRLLSVHSKAGGNELAKEVDSSPWLLGGEFYLNRLSERELVEQARASFSDRERLADSSRIGEVVAELAIGPGAERQTQRTELTGIISKLTDEILQLLLDGFRLAAQRVDALPADLDSWSADQGFGWLVIDPAQLGTAIDAALAELDSIDAARATVRKRLGTAGNRRDERPGDTFHAPAPASRYRDLYEALAGTTDPAPLLLVDPLEHRIQTSRGWIDLPPSAVRDSAWWSGSGKSRTGRPQVRAWRAAGYGTPLVRTNPDDQVTSVQFPSLPGREEWLQAHDETERVATGRFTVPPAPNTPYHAVLSYAEPSVWDMDLDELARLRVTFASPRAPQPSEHSESKPKPRDNAARSDAGRINVLVDYLAKHGETDRRGIEAFFAPEGSTLTNELDVSKWLPNLLTKASRQRRIVNIGTRKQPRWVAVGSSADLAARLTRVLERDETGGEVAKVPAPRLAPGAAVPIELCQQVIRKVFPDLAPEPLPPGAAVTGFEKGPFLTDAGMRTVLAGRGLRDEGVRALLHTIELKLEAEADAAFATAYPEGVAVEVDTEEILALADE